MTHSVETRKYIKGGNGSTMLTLRLPLELDAQLNRVLYDQESRQRLILTAIEREIVRRTV